MDEKYLKQKQDEEPDFQQLKVYITKGWPKINKIPEQLKRYHKYANKLKIEKNLLVYEDRIIIPKTLRRKSLEAIHKGHQGINKCLGRARETIWWPGIRSHIIEIIQNCEICQKDKNPNTEPMITSTIPKRPYERITEDNLTATSFDSLQRSTDSNGQPVAPNTNGQAESAVKIVKKVFRLNEDPHMALLIYRNSPLKCGQSPAELLFGRKLRDCLPILESKLKPKSPNHNEVKQKFEIEKEKQRKQYNRRHRVKSNEPLKVGERVWITNMKREGVVKEKTMEPRSYMVETEKGDIRRNRKHLMKLPNEEVIKQEVKEEIQDLGELGRGKRIKKLPKRYEDFIVG
nr:uncharacterized protein K02A2.6-like [Onthophagus taurus]